MSAGGFHTCAVRTNGNVACWGQNGVGQANPPGGAFVALSAGGLHTCGMRANGSVACWGDNGSGQATPPTRLRLSVQGDGRGWFRTSDLSRVKRALSH